MFNHLLLKVGSVMPFVAPAVLPFVPPAVMPFVAPAVMPFVPPAGQEKSYVFLVNSQGKHYNFQETSGKNIWQDAYEPCLM